MPTRSLTRALWLYGPPLALMAVIWTLSAQPDLSSGLGTADLILRKLAHMVEFGLLFLLWWRALGGRLRDWSAPAAAAIALGWAIVDELHQTTVAGRAGSPVDVAIDAAGILLAWGAARAIATRRARARAGARARSGA